MGKIKRFLDYYKGRISYTEVKNMSMREFQALYYIMYQENISTDGKEDNALNKLAEEIEDELS